MNYLKLFDCSKKAQNNLTIFFSFSGGILYLNYNAAKESGQFKWFTEKCGFKTSLTYYFKNKPTNHLILRKVKDTFIMKSTSFLETEKKNFHWMWISTYGNQ